MSQDLNVIKDALASAKVSAEKVAADVTSLHTKIDGIAEQPTAEEWAEVKEMATALKDSLAETDSQTEDVITEQPVSENVTEETTQTSEETVSTETTAAPESDEQQ